MLLIDYMIDVKYTYYSNIRVIMIIIITTIIIIILVIIITKILTTISWS